MKARDAMTETVQTLTSDTPVQVAAEILRSNGFSAAPVTDDDGNLVGIVTPSDLSKASTIGKSAGQTARRFHRHAVRVHACDVMTTPVESMTPGADVARIVAMMLERHFDCVPIVDGRSIVGVITPADLFRAAKPADADAVVINPGSPPHEYGVNPVRRVPGSSTLSP